MYLSQCISTTLKEDTTKLLCYYSCLIEEDTSGEGRDMGGGLIFKGGVEYEYSFFPELLFILGVVGPSGGRGREVKGAPESKENA